MAIPKLFHDLLAAAGPSGYEEAPTAIWRAAAREFASRVEGDVLGSSAAIVPGTSGGPTLAVMGHIDELGLIVTEIDDEGFVWLAEIGYWDHAIPLGQRVELQTARGTIHGVIGRKALSMLKEEERSKTPALHELHLDVGAKDGAQARELVEIGDVGVLSGPPLELPNERVLSRALDNRIGAYVALEVARRVAAAGGAAGDVVAVASVQEETSLAGARTSAFSLEPQVAIAVDVVDATDAPESDVRQQGRHRLGTGATLARGPIVHPEVFRRLREAASETGVPFTVQAHGDRGTRTDADAANVARAGVPCGVVSVPVRYMHTPGEMAALADIEACVELIVAFAQRLAEPIDFRR